jgi:hypothetical protein
MAYAPLNWLSQKSRAHPGVKATSIKGSWCSKESLQSKTVIDFHINSQVFLPNHTKRNSRLLAGKMKFLLSSSLSWTECPSFLRLSGLKRYFSRISDFYLFRRMDFSGTAVEMRR